MLYRKYRPTTWDEFVGQENVVRTIRTMRERGTLGGKAFFITGPSGTGKTTCAYLIAREIADEDNVEEYDSTSVTPAAIQEIERSLRFRAIGEKTGRAVVLNECHALRKDTIRQLLVTLERIPQHVVWLFTTTHTGRKQLFEGIDARPLVSRCIVLRLAGDASEREENDLHSPLLQFAIRVRAIAAREGLDGRPLETT